ncbi:MAG: hypothetical protein M1819_003758 [Sarea resinae]|nr:MAG: hypothetical protein M1819_003758 [Sarea resinae]
MASNQPPTKTHTVQTTAEQKNISVVKSYMSTAYSPSANTGRDSVAHLCAADSTFIAPTTFPESHSPLDYADSHAHVMASVADLHIVSYDLCFAKDGLVCLRYTAEGSHCGKPWHGIEKTGKTARWTAAALFEVRDGKIVTFVKDWDKLSMWKQLGWLGEHGEYL